MGDLIIVVAVASIGTLLFIGGYAYGRADALEKMKRLEK